MLTILSHGCSALGHGFGLRRSVLAAALLLPAMLLADAVRAQDNFMPEGREAARALPAMVLADAVRAQDNFMPQGRDAVRAWTLHLLAVIQAARGDVDDAKNTVAQINDPEVVRGAGDVTGVCFCNGQPLYDHPPLPAGWSLSDLRRSRVFLNRGQSPDRVPTAAPHGLPANYLAADPRHGAVVNFTDEHDSYGTRVTSRRYADGYTLIETPRADKNAR